MENQIEAKSTHLIGFATEYYTLWHYSECPQYTTAPDGTQVFTGMRQNYNYCQNLSHSEDAAQEKALKRFGKYLEVDEGLRGETRSFTRMMKENAPNDRFAYGKLYLHLITTCDDIWQLNRTYNEDGSARRRVNARRRLIELGELVKMRR